MAITSTSLDDYSWQGRTSTEQSSSEVAQSDFIQLLTAQMKNQDPTNPTDSGEFMSQLTQMNQVTAIQDLKSSFDNFATDLFTGQTLQATSMLGKSVMAPSSTIDMNESGTSTGALQLSAPANDVVVDILDSKGSLVNRINVGSMDSGTHEFSWDSRQADGSQAEAGTYYMRASGVNTLGETVDLNTLSANKVTSVSIANSKIILNTEHGDELNLSDVQLIM